MERTMKGKNFSRNRPRVERMEADYYQTPHCLTEEFLKAHVVYRWKPKSQVADFCCGNMAIQKVLWRYGYETFARDLITTENNFFDVTTIFGYGIMNPPFRLFNDWVKHCFKVFSNEFALLAPTTYLQGISRFNADGTGIFQNHDWNLSYIYTFNRYPMLSAELRPDGLIETGMQALSWFVFERIYTQNHRVTEHRWLDIDRYVLRKEKMGEVKR